MQYFNSPQFVTLPMSPGPMHGGMPGFVAGFPGYPHAMPMGWPSPQFFPAELAPAQMPCELTIHFPTKRARVDLYFGMF